MDDRGFQGMLKQPPCESQKRLPNHIQCRHDLADGVANVGQFVAGGATKKAKGDDCQYADESDEKYVLDEGGALFLTDDASESGLYSADHLIGSLTLAGFKFYSLLRNTSFVFR